MPPLLCLFNTLAEAHDFWIEPQTFRPQVGSKVPLHLRVGEDFKGDSAVFNPEQFERYIVDNHGRDLPVSGVLGDDPAGTITIGGSGLHTVFFRSIKFDVKFDSFDKFEAYLRKEGLEKQLALAKFRGGGGGSMVDSYMRCAKSLVAAPGAEKDPADRKFGCPIELIAESNPYRESELRLRLLYRDKPLEGALVVAFNKSEPANKLQLRTDRDGRVTFKLTKPGVWLVTSVHMVAAARFIHGDWESFWASLTFELPQR